MVYLASLLMEHGSRSNMPQITNVKLPNQKKPVITNVKLPEEEGMLKTAGRYAMQGVKALPYAIPGVGAANLALNVSAGGAVQETLQDLQDLWGEGRISQQQYEDAVKKVEEAAPAVAQTAPTLQNLYRLAESKTGIPFEAKTPGQRKAELFSLGAVGGPEGIRSKVFTGMTTNVISDSLQQMGIPQDLADNIALIGATASTNAIDQALRSGKFQPNISANQPQPKTNAPLALTPSRTQRRISAQAPKTKPIQPNFPSMTPPPPINPEQAEPYQISEQIINQLPGQVKLPRPPAEPKQPPLRLPPPIPEKPQPLKKPEKPPTPVEPNVPHIPPKQEIDVGAETVRFEDEVGNIISPEKALTPTEGGKDLIPAINESAKAAWQQNTNNYNLAKQLTGDKSHRFLSAAQWINNERKDLLKRPYDTLSQFEKNYLNRLTSTLNYIGKIDENGELISGSEQDVPVAQVMNIVKSINSDFNAEFQQGNKKNQYKRLIAVLNKNIEEALQKDKDALNAWNTARSFHANTWERLYENPHIQPFRSREAEFSPDKLFNRASTNPDVHIAINNILNGEFRPNSPLPSNQLKRAAAIHLLDPYIKDPSKVNGLDYRRMLAQLRNILPKEQILPIHNALLGRNNILKARQKETEKAKITKQIYKRQLQKHKEKVKEHKQTVKELEKRHAEEEKKQQAAYEKELKQYEHERDLDLDDFKKDLFQKQKEYEAELLKHKERVQSIEKAHEQTQEIKSKTPEQLFNSAHNVTFLKKLIETASKDGVDPQVIDNFRKAVGIDIVLNGKNELNPKTILNQIADVEKRRALVECFGAKEVQALQEYAKRIQTLQDLMKRKAEKITPIDLQKDLPFIQNLKNPRKALKHLQEITSGKKMIEGGFAILNDLWDEHKSFKKPAKMVDEINKKLLQKKKD